MSSPTDYEMVQVHDIQAEAEVGPEVNIEETPIDATKAKRRPPPDFSWHNIDFKAGEKYILKDCWGRVSFYFLFFYFLMILNFFLKFFFFFIIFSILHFY